MRRLASLISSVPMAVHVSLVVAALVVMGVVNVRLRRLYNATGYPVSFAEGQTTFSAATVKEHLAVLVARGTLQDYAAVQRFDYLFIAWLAAAGVLIGSLVVRLASARTAWFGHVAIIAFVVGPLFDALENLVSFGMIADPAGFPDHLALVHSTLAVLKFVSLAVGLLAVLIGFAAVARTAVRRRRPPRSATR